MDPATALSEPNATEGDAAPSTGPGNTDTDHPCSFVDLLFDTILFEKASSSRSATPKAVSGSVHVLFKELAQAFDLANKTCGAYHESHPNHAQSATLASQLTEAGLGLEDNLREYVVRNNGRGGIFLPQPARGSKQETSPGPRIALPPGDLSEHDGFDIPALESPSSFRAFDGHYAESDTTFHDMIARIVYMLRRDLWHRSILAADLDRVEKESIYRYGSRFIKARGATINEQKAAGIAASALRRSKQASGADHMELISQQLKGLQIKETDRTTYGLQGAFELPLIEPTMECYEKIDLHARVLYEYNDMRSLAQVLRRGGMIQVQPIAHARVPIVKFVDPLTRINCDVNANHVLGIHNSELIRCYTLIDDRVRPFIYNLKAIVKKHEINDSSQAWLSSYAYVMMAIGFLQAQDPPILPALQAQPEERMTSLQVQMDHEGRGGNDLIDCTFDRDHTRYRGFGAPNTKSVGQLLIEFFEFYTRYYDYQTMEVNVRLGGGVRVRDDIAKLRKMAENGNNKALRQLPQKGKGEKKLIVMDPFIRDRNVAGSCTARHLSRVWRIFESIYLTFSHGEFQKAFEAIAEYEGGQQEESQSSNRRQGAAADSHRSREKKTERKHERKRELMSKPAAAETLKPTASAPQQDRSTLKSRSAELQTASRPIVLKPTLATTSVPEPVDKEGQDDVEGEDEQLDGDDRDADGLSKSRKRRLRRTVARTLHAPQNTAAPSSPAAQRQEASSFSAIAGHGSEVSSTLQAAGQQNARKEHQQPENATEHASVPSDAAQSAKPTRRVVQTDLIKQLQEQKRHNDQLDQSRANAGGPAVAANHKVQHQQRHQPHQQHQQQQPMYPVLAKTHKILLAKTKNADEGVSAKKGGGANSNGGSQGSKRGSRSRNVQAVGLKEGL
ncbi:hypothetical protein BGZ72_007018 [Mortierella alpina]|nr:hypothetical protein BGZ72_007018 [Mortierella alpina]